MVCASRFTQVRRRHRGCGAFIRRSSAQREDQVMALTDTQTRSLKAKLKCRHVRVRELGGAPIAYVEGWHATSEANRIFGFDSWDRQTLSPRCHWSQLQHGQTICFYSTKVRITVRAG